MKKTKKNILVLAPYAFIKINNINFIKNHFNLIFKYKKENTISDGFKKRIDGLIVNPGATYKIDRNFLKNYLNLKIIVTPSTGINHIDFKFCKQRNIKLISLLNNRKVLNTITASAEFTFTLILMALRNFKKLNNNQNIYSWRTNEDFFRGYELSNKKIGIVGYGRIGKKIHKYSEIFGAKCSYFDPYKNNQSKRIKKFKTINNMFVTNDIIVLCPYLNENNHQMIDYKVLNNMKQNSFLINTSRGEIINEKDLIKFLKKRKDVIVNLDVIQNEQQKKINSALINYAKLKKSNLMITPHVAGLTYESQSKAGNFAINSIVNYFQKKS